jgi:hypothetical protein
MTLDPKPPHVLLDEDVPRLVFFISGMRAGTTVFRKMMSSHPQVRDRGEIFSSSNPQGYYRYFREQIAREPDFVFPEQYGRLFLSYIASQAPKEGMMLFDVKYEHLNLVPEPAVLPFANPLLLRLIKRSRIKVVHLRRQHFDSVVSNLVAVQTGRYHVDVQDGSPPPEKRTVVADRTAVLSAMKRRKRTTDIVDNSFDAPQRLSLDYETVFDAQGNFSADVAARLAAFLQVEDQFERVPMMKKVIDEPLANVISNYDEIKDLASISL